MVRHLLRPAGSAACILALAAILSGCASGRGYSIATTAPSLNQEEPQQSDEGLVFVADGAGGLSPVSSGSTDGGAPDFGGARYAAGNMLTGPFSGASSGLIPALFSGPSLLANAGRLGGGLTNTVSGAVGILAAAPAAVLAQGPGGANLVVASLNTQSSRINPGLSSGGLSTGGGSIGGSVGVGAAGVGGPAVGGSVSTPGVSVGPGGVSTGVGLGGFIGGVTGGSLGVSVGIGPASGGLGGLVGIDTTSTATGLGGLLNR